LHFSWPNYHAWMCWASLNPLREYLPRCQCEYFAVREKSSKRKCPTSEDNLEPFARKASRRPTAIYTNSASRYGRNAMRGWTACWHEPHSQGEGMPGLHCFE
jgi:hypothetical protein